MMPWKENCPHIDDGWCIGCVSRLGDAIEEYRDSDGTQSVYDLQRFLIAKDKLDAAMACRGLERVEPWHQVSDIKNP